MVTNQLFTPLIRNFSLSWDTFPVHACLMLELNTVIDFSRTSNFVPKPMHELFENRFLNSVSKKLSNDRFVSGAPEKVVQAEKDKQVDAEAKIKALEEQLAGMA